jgi:hypothetical protein
MFSKINLCTAKLAIQYALNNKLCNHYYKDNKDALV